MLALPTGTYGPYGADHPVWGALQTFALPDWDYTPEPQTSKAVDSFLLLILGQCLRRVFLGFLFEEVGEQRVVVTNPLLQLLPSFFLLLPLPFRFAVSFSACSE